MKFTQTDAAKKISGILTRGGKDQQLSDRTIAENIDSLMKAMVNDETELDDFIKLVEPLFKTWQANAKKDNSDFISKWEEEHKINPPAPESNVQKEENPEFKALMERIAALEADKEKTAKEASIAQKRSEIITKLKEKGVKDDKWLDKMLSKVNLDGDVDIAAEVDDILPLYNAALATGGSLPPINPSGGGNDISNDMKDVSELGKQHWSQIGFNH